MADVTVECPECGEISLDSEWCDHCGAHLSGASPESTLSWLSPGDVFDVRVEGGVCSIRVDEVVEDFATRKVFTGRDTETDEILFLEQSAGDQGAMGNVPNEVKHLFRRPFYRGGHGELVLEIYRDVGGLTIEDLVEISSRQLTYPQIKDLFEVMADTLSECHNAGFMVLAIAPWTVRVDGFAIPKLHVNDNTDTPFPDSSPVGLNEDELSDVGEEVDEIENLVGQIDSFSDSDLSAWDILDEISSPVDAMSDTGIVTMAAYEAQTPIVLKCLFEGLDRAYPLGRNPDEVPVIMGFSAPELLGRVRADITEATDVFGLGMLLYYMIAGRLPPASVYTRYAPALPVRNFRPGFPPGLQAVLSRATRPNPSDRYPTIAAFRDAFLSACVLMERRTGNQSDPPRVRMAVDTHVGIGKGRRNPTNQDAVFGKASDDGRFALMVIADGVSTASYGSGDLASKCLERRAKEVWDEVHPMYLMDERIDEIEVIQSLLERANQDIVDHVNEHHTPFSGNPHEVMGSTAVIAIIHRGTATVASLGDSRAYLYTNLGLEQLTIDHNLSTLSIIDGVPADSALAMPHCDALARCLGTFSITGGFLQAIKPQPDMYKFVLMRGDVLLLTTDGLIDFAGANQAASESSVFAVLGSEPDPALACLELILLANRGGGGDNVGVGIVQLY